MGGGAPAAEDQLNRDGTMDTGPGIRLGWHGVDEEVRRRLNLVADDAVRVHWPEVSLRGETLVWVKGGQERRLVRAPAGYALRSTEAGLVLFRDGDSPPDVARRYQSRGRVTVVGQIDTDALLGFLRSMGTSGERSWIFAGTG